MSQEKPENESEVIKSDKPKEQTRLSAVLEVVRFVAVAAILVIVVRHFIIQPFIVKGKSMVPTFENGEYLIIDELTYRFREPERGEVIVFRFPQDEKQFFIKRIIGLPGETVSVKNGEVKIKTTVTGEEILLDEEYIQGNTTRNREMLLDTDEYFVMGDNREESSDSRVWGAIEDRHIIGRALIRVLPVGEAGFLPGDYSDQLLITN